MLRSWSYRAQLAIHTGVVVFAAVVTRNPAVTAVCSVPLVIRLGMLVAAWRYQQREVLLRS
jgi:hypothetical protein